jgi:VWFA-related protein
MIQAGSTYPHFFMPRFRKQCLFFCYSAIALCLGGSSLNGQSGAGQGQSANSDAMPVFRVDTNLIQIPVLVLSPTLEKLSYQIATDRFSVSFDNNPSFHPRYARREGDDPIHLAIVLDTRSPQEDLLPKIDEAIAGLAPSFLHPDDRVSVYAISCSTMNAIKEVPGDRVQLKNAVDAALNRWTQRRMLRDKSPCSSETHLLDDLAYVTNVLARQSGWRAIVVVTDGDDRKSKNTQDQLAKLAQRSQVAILGLDPYRTGSRGPFSTDFNIVRLLKICNLSGGLELSLYSSTVAKRMQQFTQMLRDRYILEFPRPANAKAGEMFLKVGVDGKKLFIQAAGDTVPIIDQSFLGDSVAIPDASAASQQPPENPAALTPPQVAPPTEPQAAPAATAAEQPAVAPVPAEQDQKTATAETSAADSAPLLKVSTRLTVEDVTVTDAHRMPVHGLLQSDFQIKEDGKPQTIRSFEELGEQRPSSQPAPELPPNVYSNAQPPAPTTSAVNILMLDNVNNGLVRAPANFIYAKQQSMKYLAKMPEGTQVAILQLGSTLQVLQGFTSDKAVLLAAMNASSYKPVAGAYVSPPVEKYSACAAANLQSELTVDALAEAAAFLSGVKGRKNLIWFTTGTPWLTQYPAFARVSCLKDYTPQLHKAYALLNEAEIALYPIDPRGLFVNPAFTAAAQPMRGGPQAAAMQQAAFGSMTMTEHGGLQDLAEATGGVPYFNRNDLDAAVGEAIETGADYYSLAYVPPLSKYDGKFHTIDVKVDRSSLHLQYRAGYTSVDVAKPQESPEGSAQRTAPEPEAALFAAMAHGEANSTQLLFDVRVTPSTTPAKPDDPPVIGILSPALKRTHLVRYDFSYSMADQISLVDGGDGRRKASIEFVIEAYDGEGKTLNLLARTAQLTLRPDEVARFMQRPLRLPLQFDLPSGNIFVRVGVMDIASQKMGTLEIAESVAK